MSEIEYWNGSYWINGPSLTRLEGEVHEELKENVDDLIKQGISRNSCGFCTSLGRILCHCPLSKQDATAKYTMGVDTGRLYGVGCTPPKTVISWSNPQGSFYWGYPKLNKQELDLDDIVDHCLLEVEIEIEASL